MEFWKKLNGASAATLAVTVLVAALAVGLDKAFGADFSLAAVHVARRRRGERRRLAALTLFGERLVGEDHLERYRTGLVVANVIWVSGLVAVTGGVERPYWVLMATPLLIAAVTMPRAAQPVHRLLLHRRAGRRGLRLRPGRPSDVAFLVLVLPLGPGIAWFVGMLCATVWDERRLAQEERDQLARRVDHLSAVLSQAAEGDLAVQVRRRRRGQRLGRSPHRHRSTTRCSTCASSSSRSASAASRSPPVPASCSPPPRSTRPARPSSPPRSPRPPRRSRSSPRPRPRSPTPPSRWRATPRRRCGTRRTAGPRSPPRSRRWTPSPSGSTRSPPGRCRWARRARRSAGSWW